MIKNNPRRIATLKAQNLAKNSEKHAAAATTIEREFDFLMEVENVVLRGQIDLWFEEGGELVLVFAAELL